jgi:hypothetical protein
MASNLRHHQIRLDRRFPGAQKLPYRLRPWLDWKVIVVSDRRDDIEQKPFAAAHGDSDGRDPVCDAVMLDTLRKRRFAASAIAISPFARKDPAPYLGADLFMGCDDFHFEHRGGSPALRIMAIS